MTIRVEHLIEYLEQYEPEDPVYLSVDDADENDFRHSVVLDVALKEIREGIDEEE